MSPEEPVTRGVGASRTLPMSRDCSPDEGRLVTIRITPCQAVGHYWRTTDDDSFIWKLSPSMVTLGLVTNHPARLLHASPPWLELVRVKPGEVSRDRLSVGLRVTLDRRHDQRARKRHRGLGGDRDR